MKFMRGATVSGRRMRSNIPSQLYSKGNVTMKFKPGQFVSDELIKRFNIDPKYFIHPDSIMARGSFDFAHKKKGKFSVGIIRDMNGRGDVLMASVIAKALKYKYGEDVEVWFAVKKGYERILKHNPYVDRVYTGQEAMLKAVPDIKIDVNNLEFRVETKDFERDGKVIKNRASIYLEQMGLFLENKTPTYVVTNDEKVWAQEWLVAQDYDKDRPVIGLQLDGSNVSRTYPHMEKLMGLFPEDGPQFVILDRKIDDKYEFNMEQLGAIVEQCDIVVSPNSYVYHLAGALKKRAVMVCGSVDGEIWVEDYEKVSCVQIPCPIGERSRCWWTLKCLPGRNMQEKETTRSPQCLNIDPEIVLTSINEQMLESKKVLVNILTYNFLDLTKQCIDSVRSKHDYDIFVIDNESEDGTQEWLLDNNVDFLSRSMNVPEAWNLAMKKAWAEGYDYVLLCNNDIILSSTYIDTLVDTIQRRKAYAVTGQVVNKHETDQLHFQDKVYNAEKPIQIMIAGDYSALLVSMECIEEIGPFRNLAPRYQADEDHLLRIRLSGHDIVKTYATTFYHKHGAVFKAFDRQKQDREWSKGVEAFKKIWNFNPYEERNVLNTVNAVKKLNPDWETKVREPWAKS